MGQSVDRKISGYPPKPVGIEDLPSLPNGLSDIFSHQGHMLEWVITALSDEKLATQEWPHRGVLWLCQKLQNLDEDIAYGAHSHCAHALRLYYTRINSLING